MGRILSQIGLTILWQNSSKKFCVFRVFRGSKIEGFAKIVLTTEYTEYTEIRGEFLWLWHPLFFSPYLFSFIKKFCVFRVFRGSKIEGVIKIVLTTEYTEYTEIRGEFLWLWHPLYTYIYTSFSNSNSELELLFAKLSQIGLTVLWQNSSKNSVYSVYSVVQKCYNTNT